MPSFGSIGFCFDKQTHPDCMALYVVRVPQVGALPTASFRFHLTMDTLAVQLMVATANSIADFHCQAITHARRTRYPRASPWHFKTIQASLDLNPESSAI